MRLSVLITGGAGFIGSHLADALMLRGSRVYIIDDLSSGSLNNVERWLKDPRFTFKRLDLAKPSSIKELKDSHFDLIFHLAANPEVRMASDSPELQFRRNIVATYNLLEAMRRLDICERMAFTSTSTVYGEATQIPTPEDYAPLEPISVYGASKLACEALISGYAHTYGFKAVILRLANIVGPRSAHGVIKDFIAKLRKNPRRLEILGDGRQRKSYLHVSDCIDAMMLATEKAESRVEVYNVGSEDQVDVLTVARIIIAVMGLAEVRLEPTGGVNGGRGWVGDVREMLLSIERLKSLGWRPRLNSREAVRRAAEEILTDNGS